MSATTIFYLNRQRVETDASPTQLLLDFIRKQRRLTGTKEGCKEGDCGACMILLGQLVEGEMQYLPMTSCLIPLGEVHGKHVVTIEGLNRPELTPVQAAIVELGATQCGYCTPGFVVSLTGMLMDATKPLDESSIKMALGNNLCRCTGYRSLKAVLGPLQQALGDPLPDDRIAFLTSMHALPRYFSEVGQWLEGVAPRVESKTAKLIAGGTDLYVQQGLHLPDQDIQLLAHRSDLAGITKQGGDLVVGGLTTFEVFGNHPLVREMIPEMADYLLLMASWAIRNRATLAGNLVNASPIGDMTSLLLALEPRIVLKSAARGEREVALTEFYLDYKKMDRAEDEVLTQIRIPVRTKGTQYNWEKVSKRKSLDIATVNSGMRIRLDHTGAIEDVGISLGGVAAIPLFLEKTCHFLSGKKLDAAVGEAALGIAQEEFTPISDVRGSAEYKRLLANQFMVAHFTKLFPKIFSLGALYESH